MTQELGRLIENYRTHGLNEEADVLAKDLARFREKPGFPETLSAKPSSRGESLPALERFILKPRIPDREKAILRENFGASFYTLTGETIEGQKKAREEQRLPAFWYIVDAGDSKRLFAVPSPRIEVAYFDKPEDFFVPGTFGENTDTQEAMVTADAKRYGLEGITQIIPDQASIFTELTFQHLATHPGVWLFGPEYAKAQGKNWVYGRTKNPTNASGSHVAGVGYARPDRGLGVHDWSRPGLWLCWFSAPGSGI